MAFYSCVRENKVYYKLAQTSAQFNSEEGERAMQTLSLFYLRFSTFSVITLVFELITSSLMADL